MKQKPSGWARRYLEALRNHLKLGARVIPRRGAALRLGREAVTLGLASLELARIHTRALATLELSAGQSGRIKRAKLFFTTAHAPIAAQQRALRPDLKETGANRRPARARGLTESLRRQIRLRQLTHRMLVAQEAERTRLSVKLQNEIAQTLVGIQVRLLALKQEARGHTKEFKNQIASAQQLVVNSIKSVRRFARKLNSQQPASSVRALATL